MNDVLCLIFKDQWRGHFIGKFHFIDSQFGFEAQIEIFVAFGLGQRPGNFYHTKLNTRFVLIENFWRRKWSKTFKSIFLRFWNEVAQVMVRLFLLHFHRRHEAWLIKINHFTKLHSFYQTFRSVNNVTRMYVIQCRCFEYIIHNMWM